MVKLTLQTRVRIEVQKDAKGIRIVPLGETRTTNAIERIKSIVKSAKDLDSERIAKGKDKVTIREASSIAKKQANKFLEAAQIAEDEYKADRSNENLELFANLIRESLEYYEESAILDPDNQNKELEFLELSTKREANAGRYLKIGAIIAAAHEYESAANNLDEAFEFASQKDNRTKISTRRERMLISAIENYSKIREFESDARRIRMVLMMDREDRSKEIERFARREEQEAYTREQRIEVSREYAQAAMLRKKAGEIASENEDLLNRDRNFQIAYNLFSKAARNSMCSNDLEVNEETMELVRAASRVKPTIDKTNILQVEEESERIIVELEIGLADTAKGNEKIKLLSDAKERIKKVGDEYKEKLLDDFWIRYIRETRFRTPIESDREIEKYVDHKIAKGKISGNKKQLEIARLKVDSIGRVAHSWEHSLANAEKEERKIADDLAQAGLDPSNKVKLRVELAQAKYEKTEFAKGAIRTRIYIEEIIVQIGLDADAELLHIRAQNLTNKAKTREMIGEKPADDFENVAEIYFEVSERELREGRTNESLSAKTRANQVLLLSAKYEVNKGALVEKAIEVIANSREIKNSRLASAAYQIISTVSNDPRFTGVCLKAARDPFEYKCEIRQPGNRIAINKITKS